MKNVNQKSLYGTLEVILVCIGRTLSNSEPNETPCGRFPCSVWRCVIGIGFIKSWLANCKAGEAMQDLRAERNSEDRNVGTQETPARCKKIGCTECKRGNNP